MKALTLLSLVLLLSVGSRLQSERRTHSSSSSLAEFTEVRIAPGAPLILHPVPQQRIILIALEDADILFDKVRLTLRRGESRQVQGFEGAIVSAASGTAAYLLLVHVRSGHQPLTIQVNSLQKEETLEDASQRNRTLVVALSPLCLLYQRNVAAEEDQVRWLPEKPRTIRMQEGQTRWLRAGIFRLKSCQTQAFQFITVEW